MKKFLGKKIIPLAVAAVAAVGVGASLLLSPGKAVETMALANQALEDTFAEDGAVKAQLRSVVSADITGKVLSLSVTEGQSVSAGDVLLVMDAAALEAERALLTAEKQGVLASWEQSRDQTKQQIAAIDAQRAGYGTANMDSYLHSQIALLQNSLDPASPGSVAAVYTQMLDMTTARWQFVGVQMVDASRQTPAEVQALQAQLEAAEAQRLAVQNQQKQFDAQQQAQLVELEAKRVAAVIASDPSLAQMYQDLIDNLNSSSVANSYQSMLSVAGDQVARLQRDLSDAQAQIPQAYEALRTQQLALESERTALTEQFEQYKLNVQTQILSLSAQQEQAAASRASERQVRSKLGEQIDLLAQAASDDSSSASYFSAQIERIDAGLADVERRIGLARVLAPIGGIVGAIEVSEGEYLQSGMAITEIVDPATLEVECMLLTDDADTISPETPVRIVWERRDGDIEYPGKVRAVSPIAVNSVSTVGLNEQRVKVTLTPDFGEVRPGDGYQVRVFFTTAGRTGLSVPRAAVVKTDSGDAVYVVKDDRAVLTPVELGAENGGAIAVVSGLAPGDVVVKDAEGTGVTAGETVRVSP